MKTLDEILDDLLNEANAKQDIVDATHPQGPREILRAMGVACTREVVGKIRKALEENPGRKG